MGGKGAILLVLGFSMIFMVAGNNFSNRALSTTDNANEYYYETKIQHSAAAGTNIVASKVFQNGLIADGEFEFSFDNAEITASLTTIDHYINLRELVTTATFTLSDGTEYKRSNKILMKPSSFSKYAYFSDTEGADIWWTTGDTVWGPFHTNGNLRVANKPVFKGRVTIDGKVVKYSHTAKPKFLGGLDEGVHIEIPEDGVTKVGNVVGGNGTFPGHNLVYLIFAGDSIRYKFAIGDPYTTVAANVLAPNGVIFAKNAELRIKGTVKGKYTVAASGSTGNQGNIYLDDDIVYSKNPQTDPTCTDMLGIVAEEDVIITNNTANNSSININASIYAEEGSFTAENYNTRPISGSINLYGGLIQKTRGPVGTFQGEAIKHGFTKRYRYDPRFMTASPPAFPGTDMFEIVSWFEE